MRKIFKLYQMHSWFILILYPYIVMTLSYAMPLHINCLTNGSSHVLLTNVLYCILIIGNRNQNHEHVMGNTVLPSKDELNDLGITVDKNLKFSEHCRSICLKANRVSNMNFRWFTTKDKNVLLTAFKTYVSLLVKYNTPVWNPHLVKDIGLIEKVQRYFTRRLFARCDIPKTSFLFRKIVYFEAAALRITPYTVWLSNVLRNNSQRK